MSEKMDKKLLPVEAAMVKRLIKGDLDAFDELFSSLIKPLAEFAVVFLTGDLISARNISAEVLFMLFQKHADFDNVENVRMFLVVTVRDNSRHYIRHKMDTGERGPYLISDRFFNNLPPALIVKLMLLVESVHVDTKPLS